MCVYFLIILYIFIIDHKMNNADKQERPPPYFDPHRRQGNQQQYHPQQPNQGMPNPSFGGYAQAGFVPRE
jgi:hypothetical protein